MDVLEFLATQDRPVHHYAVAAGAGISVVLVLAVLTRYEREGLVVRHGGPFDRDRLWSITDAGRRRLAAHGGEG